MLPNESSAANQLARNPSWPTADVNALLRIARHLSEDKPALALAETADTPSPWLRNARGVCLMRLGRVSEAITTLRELVFASSGLAINANTEPTFQVNYAVALLLNNNADSFFAMVRGIANQQHPAVVRLQTAIRQWRSNLTFAQRIGLLFGSGPQFTLPSPLGEL